MQHNHSVYDTDTHFVIDPVTRAITNVNAKKNTLIQFDHNSEVFDFEIPRFVDGHDMLQCNEVKVHYINIDAKSSDKKNKGTYEVKDYGVLESNPNTAVFSWLISDNATQLVGVLNFLITFCCTENGVVVYRWSTGICQTVSISSGMDNGEAVIMEYPDILAQWKAELFEAGGNAVVNVTTAEANALAAIEAAGEAKKTAVLASIPDEYEAVSVLADQNHKNKAGAIVVEANGELIAVNDASEYPLQNLKLYGKSTQDGTPTPTMPVDIVSVENPVVRACGKNLMKNEAVSNTSAGITFTVNDDGSITANGTSTAVSPLIVNKAFLFKAGVSYKLTGCPVGGGTSTYRIDNVGTLFDDGDGGYITCATDTYAQIRIRIAAYVTVKDLTFYPMIRLASVGDDTYEPYNEQVFETSRTLPGIPVSNGGNYTDANGQQWVCDEVDLARGVYVKRVENKVFDGSEDEVWFFDGLVLDNTVMFRTEISNSVNIGNVVGKDFACTHFSVLNAYNADIEGTQHTMQQFYFRLNKTTLNSEDLNGFRTLLAVSPMTVIYALATPIETTLSDAEIVAFKALHTNKPNTTILNDAGAYMSASYVADTKIYIDNKIKELMEGVTE